MHKNFGDVLVPGAKRHTYLLRKYHRASEHVVLRGKILPFGNSNFGVRVDPLASSFALYMFAKIYRTYFTCNPDGLSLRMLCGTLKISQSHSLARFDVNDSCTSRVFIPISNSGPSPNFG